MSGAQELSSSASPATFGKVGAQAIQIAGAGGSAVSPNDSPAAYYGASQSLWSGNLVPSDTYGPYVPGELGVKFQVAQAGEVSGIRFYKDAQNTGTHTGHLWDAAGNLLASVTFVNESDSGWQMAMFSAPVIVQANQIYIASYSSPTGVFSVSQGYFEGSYTNDLINAPSSWQVGGNGVYSYAGPGTFPNQTYNSSNYWVDVVFAPQIPAGAATTIWSNNATPANSHDPYIPGELGEKFQVSQAGQIQGVRFYKAVQDIGTHVGRLWDANGNLLASVTFSGESATGWQSAYFSQPVSVQPNTPYIVSYSTPTGAFSYDLNYFTNGYVSGLITILSSAQVGGNGVYSYMGPGNFPMQTYEGANYWVDVFFLPAVSSGSGSGCTSSYTYPNTNRYPSGAPSCPPPLPPNPNPPNSRAQDQGPIHPCMEVLNGVRYQAIVITGLYGAYPMDSTLYFGAGCNPSQFADEILFGQTINFQGPWAEFYIHYWDEPATSATWTIGNFTSQCIDYSKVSDCQ